MTKRPETPIKSILVIQSQLQRVGAIEKKNTSFLVAFLCARQEGIKKRLVPHEEQIWAPHRVHITSQQQTGLAVSCKWVIFLAPTPTNVETWLAFSRQQ